METFEERFKAFLQHIRQSPTQFAHSLGKSPTIFTRVVNGETKPSFEILEMVFKTHPELSRDWLMLGIGEMILKDKSYELQGVLYDPKYVRSLEDRVAEQSETIKVLLGKSEGVIIRPLYTNEVEELAIA